MKTKRFFYELLVAALLLVILLPAGIYAQSNEKSVKAQSDTGPEYISELNVFTSDSSVDEAWKNAKAQGWSHYLNLDLNSYAGGDYIVLVWNTTTNINDAVRSIVVDSQKPGEAGTNNINGCTYAIPVDLNNGAGGSYVYLYYGKDTSLGKPISNIDALMDDYESSVGFSGWEAVRDMETTAHMPADVNEGTSGRSIILYYQRYLPVTINEKAFTYEKTDDSTDSLPECDLLLRFQTASGGSHYFNGKATNVGNLSYYISSLCYGTVTGLGMRTEADGIPIRAYYDGNGRYVLALENSQFLKITGVTSLNYELTLTTTMEDASHFKFTRYNKDDDDNSYFYVENTGGVGLLILDTTATSEFTVVDSYFWMDWEKPLTNSGTCPTRVAVAKTHNVQFVDTNGSTILYQADVTDQSELTLQDDPSLNDGKSYLWYCEQTDSLIARGDKITVTEDLTFYPSVYTPVSDLSLSRNTATAGEVTKLETTFSPENVSYQDIEWSIVSDGGTQTQLGDNTILPHSAGTLHLQATVKYGLSSDKPFTKDFYIVVSENKEPSVGLGLAGFGDHIRQSLLIGDADGTGSYQKWLVLNKDNNGLLISKENGVSTENTYLQTHDTAKLNTLTDQLFSSVEENSLLPFGESADNSSPRLASLTEDEITNANYGFLNDQSRALGFGYWLSYDYQNTGTAPQVTKDGAVITTEEDGASDQSSLGMLPAAKVSKDSVILNADAEFYNSASVGQWKESDNVASYNTRKLILNDASKSVSVSNVSASGNKVQFSYQADGIGSSEYLSAVIVDMSGDEPAVLYYQPVTAINGDDSNKASGTASIDLPGSFDYNNLIVYVYAEKKTSSSNEASTLVQLQIPTEYSIQWTQQPDDVTCSNISGPSSDSLTVSAVVKDSENKDQTETVYYDWYWCSSNGTAGEPIKKLDTTGKLSLTESPVSIGSLADGEYYILCRATGLGVNASPVLSRIATISVKNSYWVTVTDGTLSTGSKSALYQVGDTVELSPLDKTYWTGWKVSPEIGGISTLSANSFTMPASDVTVTGMYQDSAAYKVTIVNGTKSPEKTSFYRGETVSIKADRMLNGKVFSRWVVKKGTAELENQYSTTTKFTMPVGEQEIEAVYTDIVAQVVPLILTSSLPLGTQGTEYTTQLEAACTEPVTWSYVGRLHQGLTLNPATGEITGTPSEAMIQDIGFYATSASGKKDYVVLRLAVYEKVEIPTIDTLTLPSGTTGQNYREGIQLTPLKAVSLDVTDGALPDGLKLTGDSGSGYVISGTPETEGSYSFELTASNKAGSSSRQFTIGINQKPVIRTLLPVGTAGQGYTGTLQATGSAPITWEKVTGDLPDGLELNGDTITGTPTASGEFTFTVKASNSYGSDSRILNLIVSDSALKPAISVGEQQTEVESGTEGAAAYPLSLRNITSSSSNGLDWYQDSAGLAAGTEPDGITQYISYNETQLYGGLVVCSDGTTKPGIYYFRIHNTENGIATLSNVGILTVTGTLPEYTLTYKAGADADANQQDLTDTKTQGTELKLKGASFIREGYTQTGWALTDGGAKAYDLEAGYTDDTAATLYPVWTENGIVPETYTLTYKAGADADANQQDLTDTKTQGTELKLKGAIFTREGYTQTGWALTDGGAKAYDLEVGYTDDQAATLYPVWTENGIVPETYTLTYKAGADADANQQDLTDTKTQGTEFKLKGASFTREGYTQTGWALTDGGAKAYDLEAGYTDDIAATLYPVWTKNGIVPETYTLTYKAGADADANQQDLTDTKTQGTEFKLKGASFTREGYTQTGWALTDGGAKAYDLEAGYTDDTAATLYPVWTKISEESGNKDPDQNKPEKPTDKDQTLVNKDQNQSTTDTSGSSLSTERQQSTTAGANTPSTGTADTGSASGLSILILAVSAAGIIIWLKKRHKV